MSIERQFIVNVSKSVITQVVPYDLLKGDSKYLGFQVTLEGTSNSWCLERYYAYINSGVKENSDKPDYAQFITNQYSSFVQHTTIGHYPIIKANYKCDDHFFLVKEYCWVAYVSFMANNEKNYLKYYAEYDSKKHHGIAYYATFISEAQYRAETSFGDMCKRALDITEAVNELYAKDKELVQQVLSQKLQISDLPFDSKIETGKEAIERLRQFSEPITLQIAKQDNVNLLIKEQKK